MIHTRHTRLADIYPWGLLVDPSPPPDNQPQRGRIYCVDNMVISQEAASRGVPLTHC